MQNTLKHLLALCHLPRVSLASSARSMRQQIIDLFGERGFALLWVFLRTLMLSLDMIYFFRMRGRSELHDPHLKSKSGSQFQSKVILKVPPKIVTSNFYQSFCKIRLKGYIGIR